MELDVGSSALATKWWKALLSCLKTNRVLEKTFLVVGVPRSERSWDALLLDLRRNLEILGMGLPKGSDLNRDKLNELHHEFEIRIGQVWNPGARYLSSNHLARHAIRQINHLVHEAEALREFETQRVPKPAVLASFYGAPRGFLEGDDFREFSLETRFGDVFLHYCQLGKTHLEAFNDRDDHIDVSNINGLRYYTGEFDLYLRPEMASDAFKLMRESFDNWLRQRGFDPKDPKLALGHAKIAELSKKTRTLIPDSKTALELLAAQSDLFRISCFENGNLLREREYRYSVAQCDRLVLGISQDSPVKQFLFDWGRRWPWLEQKLLG